MLPKSIVNLILLIVIWPSLLTAQTSPDIFIKAFATNDSVMLRWVPANIETWKNGNRYGYSIERFTTDEYLDMEGQNPEGKGKVITTIPILPLPKTDSTWNKLFRADKINAFVFQMLYEEPNVTGNDPKKEAEAQMKFGFILKACDLSLATAQAQGLYFTDKSIEKGQSYIYRIRLAQLPSNLKHTPGIVSADAKLSVLHSPDKLSGEFRNRKVAISFNISSTRESYAGYIIERSEDSIHYARINNTLLTYSKSQYETTKTELVYQDSFPLNNVTYWYRVRGYSYFGFSGPPSKAIKGKGKEAWILFPEVDTLFSSDEKSISIFWQVPKTNNNSELKGFLVLRSSKAEGPFTILNKTIIDPNRLDFKDDQALYSSYYEIAALSIYGDTAFSFPYFFGLPDNNPPPIPENIHGTIDTNGIVHLTWNNVQANDLKGYRVFRCNSMKEELIEVSDSILPTNYFMDTVTIRTLTRTIYYTIRSVDLRYNNSQDAPIYILKRPDKISPVAAVIKSIYQTDTTITFSWINSSSDDVMCFELSRKSSSGKIMSLGNWHGNDTVQFFTDKLLVPGEEYTYTLALTDSAGNKTNTTLPTVRFQPRIYPSLNNISALPDFEKRIICISWETPQQTVDRYVIYKSKKGEALRIWKTIDGNNFSIIDKELYPGNIYHYQIKAIFKSGAESKLSSIDVVY